MQRSDLGSDCHSHYKYKPELDTLHPRIEDEVRLADTFGGAPPVTQFKMLETTSALALNLLNRINAIITSAIAQGAQHRSCLMHFQFHKCNERVRKNVTVF